MVVPDLKLVVAVDLSQPNKIPEVVRQANEKVNAENKRAGDQADALAEKYEIQKIARQRNSIALDESLRTKTQADYERWWQRQLAIQDQAEAKKYTLQRNSIAIEEQAEKQRAAKIEAIERQAAIAESSLVLDKFDRRIAIERTKHAQILADLKGNDIDQEAEIRRHNAVVSRIQMDKANLPNTPFQQLLGGMTQSMGLADGAMGMAAMAGGALGAALAITKLGEAIHGAVDAAMDMQTIHQTLDFAAGSAKKGAEDFEFLEKQSRSLGISLKESAPEFARMQAAAMGTSLAGKGVRDVFKSMSEAAVTLHLDTDSTSRGFYALREMMEMTTVQTRQMRMLALAIPGAFQDAAKAVGTTTEGLMQMMKHGQVMTDDFLPKFAAVMHDKFEKPSVDASQNARQQIQIFKNEIFETAAAVGEPLLHIAGAMATAFTTFTNYGGKAGEEAKALREEMERLQKVAGSDAFNPEMLGNMTARGDIEAQARKNVEAMRIAKMADEQDQARASATENVNLARLEKQIESQTRLEEELQISLAAVREDGLAKKEAQENLRYTKEKEHLLGSHKEIELAEKIHQANMAAIQNDATEKANKAFEKRSEKDREAQMKAFADRDRTNAQAKQEMERLKKENGAAEVANKQNAPAARAIQLEQDRQDELKVLKEKFGDTQYWNEIVYETNRKYQDKNNALLAEDKKRSAELFAAKTGYYQQYAQSVSQMIGIIGGKSKAAFLAEQALAEAEIAMRTAVAWVTDNSNPLTVWKVPYDIALGAAQGAVVAGTTLKGFAGGTDYAPPGLAWVGERGPELVNFRGGEQVHTATQSARMASQAGHSFSVTVNMAPGTSAADAHAIADNVDARLRNLVKDLDEIDYRNIRRAGRA